MMPNLGGMASVLPGGVNKEQPLRERKATYMPLLLDDQGSRHVWSLIMVLQTALTFSVL